MGKAAMTVATDTEDLSGASVGVGVSVEALGEDSDWVQSTSEGRYLPPIYRIKMPETTTQSATIRWLHALGYPVKEIARGLNVRYQQARNIIVTIPKRAAREDLPPLEIQLLDMADAVDELLGGALEADFAKARKDEKRRKRAEDASGNAPTEPSDEEFMGFEGEVYDEEE